MEPDGNEAPGSQNVPMDVPPVPNRARMERMTGTSWPPMSLPRVHLPTFTGPMNRVYWEWNLGAGYVFQDDFPRVHLSVLGDDDPVENPPRRNNEAPTHVRARSMETLPSGTLSFKISSTMSSRPRPSPFMTPESASTFLPVYASPNESDMLDIGRLASIAPPTDTFEAGRPPSVVSSIENLSIKETAIGALSAVSGRSTFSPPARSIIKAIRPSTSRSKPSMGASVSHYAPVRLKTKPVVVQPDEGNSFSKSPLKVTPRVDPQAKLSPLVTSSIKAPRNVKGHVLHSPSPIKSPVVVSLPAVPNTKAAFIPVKNKSTGLHSLNIVAYVSTSPFSNKAPGVQIASPGSSLSTKATSTKVLPAGRSHQQRSESATMPPPLQQPRSRVPSSRSYPQGHGARRGHPSGRHPVESRRSKSSSPEFQPPECRSSLRNSSRGRSSGRRLSEPRPSTMRSSRHCSLKGCPTEEKPTD